MEIDSHIGCAMSGLTADARTLIDHARVETQVTKTNTHFSIHCTTLLPWMPCCSPTLSISLWHELKCPPYPSLLQQHRFSYNEPMPVESCTQSLCDLALRFGEDGDDGGMVKPLSTTPLGSLSLPPPNPPAFACPHPPARLRLLSCRFLSGSAASLHPPP